LTDTPALEVGFAITPQYEGLTQLESGMDRATASILAEAEKIEKATGGMIKLGGATAQVTAFGNAATREMAEAAREMKNAERSGEGLARQLQRQVEVYGKTASEIRNMRAEQRALAAESRGLTELASRIRALNTEMNRLETANVRAAPSMGATRQAMSGLSFQAQDAFTQLSMGANVFNVLAIQGAQAAGQMAGLGGALGKVANFMIGPWGLALTGGVLVLGALTKGLFDSAEAAKEKEKAAEDLADAIDQLESSTRSAIQTEWDSQRATLASAQAMRQKALDTRAATLEVIAHTRASLAEAIAESARPDPSQGQDGGLDFALVRAGQLETKLKQLDAELSTQQRNFEKTEVAFRNAQAAVVGSEINARIDRTAGATRNYQKALSALNSEFAKTGDLSAYTNARMRLEQQFVKEKEAIQEAGKSQKGLTDEQREANKAAAAAKRAYDGLARSLETLIGRFDPARKAAKDFHDTLAEIDKLIANGMLGSGDAIGMKIKAAAEAKAAEAKARADELKSSLGYTMGGADDPDLKMFKQWEDAAEAARQYRVEADLALNGADAAVKRHVATLRLVTGVLDEISPVLGSIGGALEGLSTGDFSGVRGKAGALLQMVQLSTGKDGWEAIVTELDNIFGTTGSFKQTLADALKSSGIGMVASQLVNGSGGSPLGAALGGAIGGKLGDKLGSTMAKSTSEFVKGIADFAGPIGSILGGVLGGIIGGLFKKAPSASAIVTSATGGVQIGGNDADAKRAVGVVSDSLQQSIIKVADALGGTLGQFAVSIGKREDYFRVAGVATTAVGDKHPERGTGVTLLYNGQDAEEAMRIALLTAIQQGAVAGIDAGVARLLQSGNDLEVQLQKALSFQGVFDQLKQRLDPTAFAMDNLDKSAKKLRETFAEAGATAEQYAKLEQLIALQRQDILDEAAKKDLEALNERRALEVRLLEAQGKAVEALALSRQIELSETDAALRAMLQQVYAAEDATSAAKAAADAAEDLRKSWEDVGSSITDEVKRIRGLTDATGGNSFAVLMGQFNAATTAARAGDLDAAKSLPQLSQALLGAAAESARSRQDLARVQAQTAASLEATNAAMTGLTSSANTSNAALLAASANTQAAAEGSNDNAPSDLLTAIAELRAEVAQLRAENNSGNAAIAGNTGRVATHLDNLTGPSGGDALAVVQTG
jgi:hypothetical protein